MNPCASGYRHEFDEAIHQVLEPCLSPMTPRDGFWPAALSEEGVDYGRGEGLPAAEAAAWYLSAAVLVRMTEGEIGVPLATRLLRTARGRAKALGMGAGLQAALARIEDERRDWILHHHEFQGAGLRERAMAVTGH